MSNWVLLTYRVPRQPSACRAFVWRKLKKLGAVALQDAIWVLPANDQTKEHFLWLSSEIVEMEGEATVWLASTLMDGQEATLIDCFTETVESSYRSILSALKGKKPDLAALSRQFQQTLAQDYFGCRLGKQAREALLKAQGAKKR